LLEVTMVDDAAFVARVMAGQDAAKAARQVNPATDHAASRMGESTQVIETEGWELSPESGLYWRLAMTDSYKVGCGQAVVWCATTGRQPPSHGLRRQRSI
jgi:hypothetical protein